MNIVKAGLDITKIPNGYPNWETTVAVIELLPFLSVLVIIVGAADMLLKKKAKKKSSLGGIIVAIGIVLLLFSLLAYFTLTVI